MLTHHDEDSDLKPPIQKEIEMWGRGGCVMLIAVQLWVHVHVRSDGVFWWG